MTISNFAQALATFALNLVKIKKKHFNGSVFFLSTSGYLVKHDDTCM